MSRKKITIFDVISNTEDFQINTVKKKTKLA